MEVAILDALTSQLIFFLPFLSSLAHITLAFSESRAFSVTFFCKFRQSIALICHTIKVPGRLGDAKKLYTLILFHIIGIS